MARGELRYDSTTMHELLTDITAVKSEFEHADKRTGNGAESVGHQGLADRIRSFSSEWDGMRDKLLENIGDMAKALSAIDDGFDTSEQKLVDALKGDR